MGLEPREGSRTTLLHRDTTDVILASFFAVYNELGPGFLESVYRRAMVFELADRGVYAIEEAPLDVHFKGRPVGLFRADLVVAHRVVVEIKTAAALIREHEAQLLNYLLACRTPVGLLLNFGPKPTFKRLIQTNLARRHRD